MTYRLYTESGLGPIADQKYVEGAMMRVFLTGATGWVGGRIVDDLLHAGHQVLCLVRGEEKAAMLSTKGAEPLCGTLDDCDRLAEAAGMADAVIHVAFEHDFSKFAESSKQEELAMEAMGSALIGTDKLLLYTAGLALLAPGQVVTEADMPPPFDPNFPRRNEVAAAALAERGVRVSGVRLATTVHGVGDRMFLAFLADLARNTGVSAYIGDGANRWPAVHVSDAGRLYRLACESSKQLRYYHACAEEGVTFFEIAKAIGQALGLPVEPRPPAHFGWLRVFVEADAPASSSHTREITGWSPSGPELLSDIAKADYFKNRTL